MKNSSTSTAASEVSMDDDEEIAEGLNAEQAHEDMILEDTKTIVVEKKQLYTTKSGDIKVLPAAASYKIPKTKRLVCYI